MHLQRLYGALYKTEEDIAWDNVIRILRSEKEEETKREVRRYRLYQLGTPRLNGRSYFTN